MRIRFIEFLKRSILIGYLMVHVSGCTLNAEIANTETASQPMLSFDKTSIDATDGDSILFNPKLSSSVTKVTLESPTGTGLSVNPTTGEVSGKWVSGPGSYSLTFKAIDVSGAAEIKTINLTVAAWPIQTSSQLKIWLKADTGVFTDRGTLAAGNSNNIMTWMDQSGNGNHFINVQNHFPILVSDGLNGKPSLQFRSKVSDGSAATLCLSTDLSSCTNIFAADRTIFVVGSVDLNSNYWQTIYSTRTGFTWDPANQTSLTTGGPGLTDDQMLWFADNSSGNFTFYPENKSNLGKAFLSEQYSNVPAQKNLYIGGAINIYIPFNGKVSEFLVFQGALTAEESGKIRRHLAQKYKVTIP